jgi:hypothetical protein
LVKAVIDIQMASAHVLKCTYSYTPPKDPLEAALSDLYPTPLFTAIDKVESKELKAQALTLEFKKVNKVYIYARL